MVVLLLTSLLLNMNESGADKPGAAGVDGETPVVGVAEQRPAGGAAGGAAGTADAVGNAAIGTTVDFALAANGADVISADAPEQVVGQVAEQQAASAQQPSAGGRQGLPRQ